MTSIYRAKNNIVVLQIISAKDLKHLLVSGNNRVFHSLVTDFAIDCPDIPLARKIFILVSAERILHPDRLQ